MVVFSSGATCLGIPAMLHEELLALLTRARAVLERHLLDADGETLRDDVAEVCMAIDDALPAEGRVPLTKAALERTAA
jgi:hypothetical protein